jgi:hypothetical protein
VIAAPATAKAQTIAVSGTSTMFARVLDPREFAWLTSTTACYVAQGPTNTVTAAAGAGTASMYVPANVPVKLTGFAGAYVAIVQASAGGFASLTPLFV